MRPASAIELVHMASLVHDDLIDGAELRRGRASVWSAYGPEAARAGGVYLFARAFAELAATGDADGRRHPRRLRPCARPRGGARARPAAPPRHDRRGVPGALHAEDREALRGGLPARRAGAASSASSASRSASPSRSSTTASTAPARRSRRGRSPARTCAKGSRRCRSCSPRARTRSCADALAGGSLDGALLRVAASGAIEEAREVAREYAEQARACLEGRRGARGARRDRRRRGREDRVDGRPRPHLDARARSARRWRPASGSTSRTGSR